MPHSRPPLDLVFESEGEPRTLRLPGGGGGAVAAEPWSIGRGLENRLVLTDPSVSRRHAELRPEPQGWAVVDLGSTNGVAVNGSRVRRARLAAGDRLRVGTVEIEVRAGEEGLAAPDVEGEGSDAELLSATVVRRLEDLPPELLATRGGSGAVVRGKRRALEAAYANQVFGHLTRLAGSLLDTDSLEEVLRRVTEVAFDALPVDRGFIFLRAGGDESGGLVCELARSGERVEVRPAERPPVSRSMLRKVIEERIAVVVPDAGSAQRIEGAESMRVHRVRSAMCAPLWSGERVVGAMVLDSVARDGPDADRTEGRFGERDLELVSALANFAAVAIERIRYAERVAHERRLRARLERYHSPAVVGDVLGRGELGPGERSHLARAEVSVLFADLAGFTPFAESAEPEAVAELLARYFRHAVEAIFAAGGTLDKFIGDGVMAFFGAPVAQPDHARRALTAAAAIRDAAAAWGAEREASGEPAFRVRIAVHSGPVVVGEVGSEHRVDYTVLGNTVNVAARLEGAAEPGEVWLSAATRELAGEPPGLESEPVGDLTLTGLSKPVTAYRLR